MRCCSISEGYQRERAIQAGIFVKYIQVLAIPVADLCRRLHL
jgi:hypothetical protein